MACDLTLTSLTPTPATTVGGYGFASLVYRTGSDGGVTWVVDGPEHREQSYTAFNDGTGVFYLLAGTYTYTLRLQNQPDCQVSGTFTIDGPAPAQVVDPSVNDAPRWEPVGGVLPNPVLLKVEAVLTDGLGTARPGLHVEVELWRPDAIAAFATFRATVREATHLVDAAPYLRAQLRALQRYAATAAAPLVDADASLRFYYRYRVVDKTGAEPWLTRAGARYAVLAALAGPADTMGAYVADTTGTVASVFDDYEATQFVGYPLEASVLLPPYTAPRWAELRYVDAWGNAVEIRSYALASTLPAGMLRIPLPNDPPLCATAVEVSVRDDNRAFVGTCGHVTPLPPASTRGTYAEPVIGLF